MNKCSRCHKLFAGEDVLFLGPYTLCPCCRSSFSRFMDIAQDTDMKIAVLQRFYDKEKQRCRDLEVSLNEIKKHIKEIDSILQPEDDADPRAEMGKELGV